MKFPLLDVDWSKSNRNIVLALSTSCHFCTESVPFYRRLDEQRAEHDEVRLIVVMPQSVVDSKRYIDDKNLVADDVRQIKLSDIYVAGTPTLIVVDQTGAVVESWVGRLPPEKESEVQTRVFGERAKL